MTNSRMLRAWLNPLPSVFGGIGLLLVIINGVLGLANRATQAEAAARAQYINQTVQLNNISQAIIRAAASAAVNNKDTQLGDLLTANGIRYEVTQPAPSAAPAAPVASAAAPARPAQAAPARPVPTPAAPGAQAAKGGK